MFGPWNLLPNYAIIFFPFRKKEEQYASFTPAEVLYKGPLEAKWIECDLGKNNIEYGRVIALFDNPEEMKQKYSVCTEEFNRQFFTILTARNMSMMRQKEEFENEKVPSLSERIESWIENCSNPDTPPQDGMSLSSTSAPNSNRNDDVDVANPGPSSSLNANLEEPEPSTSTGRVLPEHNPSTSRTPSRNPKPASLNLRRPSKPQLRRSIMRQIMTTSCVDAKKLKANRKSM